MVGDPQSQVLTRIDYASTFQYTRLFNGFRMAIHPGKLLPALLMVVVIFLGGKLLGAMFGRNALPGEFAAYQAAADGPGFDEWRDNRRKLLESEVALLMTRHRVMTGEAAQELSKTAAWWHGGREAIHKHFSAEREKLDKLIDADPPPAEDQLESLHEQMRQLNVQQDKMLDDLKALMPQTVFDAALGAKLDAFRDGAMSAVHLRIGIDQLDPTARPDSKSMIGSIRVIVMTLPGWLWHAHWWFFIAYLVYAGLVISLLGGAISRQAVVEAAQDRRISATEAVRFAFARWGGFIAAPLIAPAVVAVVALMLAVGGLLFYVPVTDIVAAFLFVLALGGGFIMVVMLIGWVAGVHLMYPALSAQGSDAFDAMCRAYSYAFSRPWRLLLYTLITLVYGAATYLFVGLVVFLLLSLTHMAAGAWVGDVSGVEGVTRFEALWPRPTFGELMYEPRWEHLGPTGKLSAVLVMVWVYLVVAVVAAYAFSYYFCAYSVIYLLLRRYTDGVDITDIYEPPSDSPGPEKLDVDKVEPAATADGNA